jgi:hypothetical protein
MSAINVSYYWWEVRVATIEVLKLIIIIIIIIIPQNNAMAVL